MASTKHQKATRGVKNALSETPERALVAQSWTTLVLGIIFVCVGTCEGLATGDPAWQSPNPMFLQRSVNHGSAPQRCSVLPRLRGARGMSMTSQNTSEETQQLGPKDTNRGNSNASESLADKINKYDMERVSEKLDAGEFDAPTFPRPLLSSAQGLLSRIGPVLLLNFVTVLWGSQHAVIKLAVDSSDGGSPAQLNLLRFAIAALIFLPFAPPLPDASSLRPRDTASEKGSTAAAAGAETTQTGEGVAADVAESSSSVWLAGGWLGLFTFAGYAMQSVGLQYTSASRSAFLLYLNVKLVPIFARVLYGRRISRRTWASAAVALLGTALLGFDGAAPNLGDAWSLGAAGASALFILSLEGAAREHDSAELNSVAQMTVALLCLGWVLLVDRPGSLAEVLPGSQAEVLTAVYLGVVTTALTSFLQTKGQQTVKAEKAAIIYAMDPVYAAGFSYLLLEEQLGLQGLGGAALLILAALFSRPGPRADSDPDAADAAAAPRSGSAGDGPA